MVLLLFTLFLLVSCSPKTIDSTTDESFKSSIKAMKESLSEEESDHFGHSLFLIASDHPKLWPTEATVNTEKALLKIKDDLHGKTVDDINAQGKTIGIKLDKQAKRIEAKIKAERAVQKKQASASFEANRIKGDLEEVCQIQFPVKTDKQQEEVIISVYRKKFQDEVENALYVAITYDKDSSAKFDLKLFDAHSPVIEKQGNKVVVLYTSGVNTTCVAIYSMKNGKAEFKYKETIAWNDGGRYRQSKCFPKYESLLKKRNADLSRDINDR